MGADVSTDLSIYARAFHGCENMLPDAQVSVGAGEDYLLPCRPRSATDAEQWNGARALFSPSDRLIRLVMEEIPSQPKSVPGRGVKRRLIG